MSRILTDEANLFQIKNTYINKHLIKLHLIKVCKAYMNIIINKFEDLSYLKK